MPKQNKRNLKHSERKKIEQNEDDDAMVFVRKWLKTV